MSDSSNEAQKPMGKVAATALGVFVTALLVVPMSFTIHNLKEDQEALKLARTQDPSVMRNCTVTSVDELDAHPSRGGTDYTVKVRTEECGKLLLTETPTLPDGAHMEVYRELELGETYRFALRDGEIIYSVESLHSSNSATEEAPHE